MTTLGDDYGARIRRELGKPAAKAGLTSGFAAALPTVSFLGLGQDDGIFSKIAYWLIIALLITFVVMLILVIIHYTVTPIFNFGDNPGALINLTVPDWTKSWYKVGDDGKLPIFKDVPGDSLLPVNNYSIILDTYVNDIAPSNETGNVYVFAYKTAAREKGDTSSTSATAPIKGADGKEYVADLLTNFSFLETPSVPVNSTGAVISSSPSFVVAYNAISGHLTVYFVTSVDTNYYMKTVSVPISPKQKYRVGVIVSTNLVEVYLNGQLAGNQIYPGQAIAGTANDIIIATPSAFTSKVRVGNLFTVGRVVTSGEIRAMGGPSTLNVD